MKKNLLSLAAALLAAFALSTSAVANPISGSIAFNATPTLNSSDIASATAVTGFVPFAGEDVWVFPGTQFGSYSAIPSFSGVTFATFSFAPATASITPLWTLTYLGVTYSFDSTSMTSVYDSVHSIWNIGGEGIAHITGYDDTPGVWNVTIAGSGSSFSFGSTTAVPDGAATALLVGLGLVGMSLVARRKA